MKRKNILFRAHLAAVLFLLFLSPAFAQNSYVIGLDSLEWIVVNQHNLLNVTSDWTFEAWINVHTYNPADDECIMDRRQSFSFYLIPKNTGGDYAIRFAARDIIDINIATLSSDGLGDGDTETQMDFNTWYHVAATFDGDTARLYINSTETDTDIDTNWNFNTSYSWTAMSIGAKTLLNYSDTQTTTNSNPYSVDTNTNILMHLDDLAVPHPTFVSGLLPPPLFSIGYNIDSSDYIPASGLPLPVELTSFSAQVNKGEVTLNWETETEVDNYGFDIERKTKEERRETWEAIGFVEGHGNSNSPKQYSFTDKNPVGGSDFSYRLKQIDTDGKFEYSDFVEVLLVPDEFFLSQNFPNPFNPSTTIEFSLTQTSHITLEIFNTLGERMEVLASEELSVGTYSYKWDASNLTSGIYFYILKAGDFIQTRKMILLK